jgi:hypothetical protein
MKIDKNFNLSKSTKRILASIVDKEQRLVFKKTMIDAEASYEDAKKRQPKERTKETIAG